MTLLDFARGPALEASLIIFVVGTLWRFLGTLLLPWRLIAAEPRAGAPSAFVAALRGIVVKLWPYEPFQKSGVVQFVNGYIFHLGLAVVVFLFVPHILFIRSLTGLSWPGLPNNLVMMVGVITAASLIVALVFRLTSPVLRLISRADDYISWLMTFLPVATGLLAAAHLGLPYETLLTLHILSLCAFFIWFPFGKLMHAFLFVFSRGMTGIRLGQRGRAMTERPFLRPSRSRRLPSRIETLARLRGAAGATSSTPRSRSLTGGSSNAQATERWSSSAAWSKRSPW